MDKNQSTTTAIRLMFERGRLKISKVLGANGKRGKVTITLANLLTLTRLIIIPFFWVLYFTNDPILRFFATLLFSFGAITDLWDGKIARMHNEETEFGNFMDPLTDKLLVLSAFWSILLRDNFGILELTGWGLVVSITLRELIVTLLRMKKIEYGTALVTSFWGKIKTGVQLTTLIGSLLLFNIQDYLSYKGISIVYFQGIGVNITIMIFFGLSAIASIASGILYFVKPK